MSKDIVMNDCWIIGQLAGIRALERELTHAFKSGAREENLRQRVAKLNAWVTRVDRALSRRAGAK